MDIQNLRTELLDLYAGESYFQRFHVYIKLLMFPLFSLDPLVPDKGTIVDAGCGDGLIANMLVLSKPERSVYGFDLDPQKIETAKLVSRDRANVTFERKDIGDCDLKRCDCVIISDVFYLLDDDTKRSFLTKAYRVLSPGGLLLVKEVDTHPRWKFLFNYMQELMAVRVLGWTEGQKFYFWSAQTMKKELADAGFSQIKDVPLHQGYPYSHVAYTALREE